MPDEIQVSRIGFGNLMRIKIQRVGPHYFGEDILVKPSELPDLIRKLQAEAK